MMSTALVRPRTSRRLRMRDIHVIYADSNSLVLKIGDRQTRLERRRQQERERRARETPGERDRRRSLRNQRDRERRRARCAARCASALAQLERVCTCIIIRIRIYIRELAHARPPMPSISLVLCGSRRYPSRLCACALSTGTGAIVVNVRSYVLPAGYTLGQATASEIVDGSSIAIGRGYGCIIYK